MAETEVGSVIYTVKLDTSQAVRDAQNVGQQIQGSMGGGSSGGTVAIGNGGQIHFSPGAASAGNFSGGGGGTFYGLRASQVRLAAAEARFYGGPLASIAQLERGAANVAGPSGDSLLTSAFNQRTAIPEYGPGNSSGELRFRAINQQRELRRDRDEMNWAMRSWRRAQSQPESPEFGPGNDAGEMQARAGNERIIGRQNAMYAQSRQYDISEQAEGFRGLFRSTVAQLDRNTFDPGELMTSLGYRPAQPYRFGGGGGMFAGRNARLLALGAVSEGARVVDAGRHYSIALGLAGGNTRSQLDATLAYRAEMTGGFLGVGKLADIFNDPSGGGMLGVRQAVAAADSTDANSRQIGAYGEYTRGVGRAANIAATGGFERQRQQNLNDFTLAKEEAIRQRNAAVDTSRQQILDNQRSIVGALPANDPRILRNLQSGTLGDLKERMAQAREAVAQELAAPDISAMSARYDKSLANTQAAQRSILFNSQVAVNRGEKESFGSQQYQNYSNEYAMKGNTLHAGINAVLADFVPVLDSKGKIISYRGLDPTDKSGFAQAFALKNQAYQQAMNGVILDEGRANMSAANYAGVAALNISHDPRGAAFKGIKSQYDAAELGMKPGSAEYRRLELRRQADSAELRQRYEDQDEMMRHRQDTQGYVLDRLSKFDPGAELGARAVGIEGGTIDDMRQMFLNGTPDDLIRQRGQLGEKQLDSEKAGYLRSFKALQINSFANLDSDANSSPEKTLAEIKDQRKKIDDYMNSRGYGDPNGTGGSTGAPTANAKAIADAAKAFIDSQAETNRLLQAVLAVMTGP